MLYTFAFNPNRAVISISTYCTFNGDMFIPFFQSQPGCHLHFDAKPVQVKASLSLFQSQPGCHLHFDCRPSIPIIVCSQLSIPTGLSSPFRRQTQQGCLGIVPAFNPNRAVISISTVFEVAVLRIAVAFNPNRAVISISTHVNST